LNFVRLFGKAFVDEFKDFFLQ